MSQTNRWYTFSRVTPLASGTIEAITPGTVYEVYGWSRTKEAAIAKRDKLDRAGRAGINVFSPSLQQAMVDVMEVYRGVVVQGYISPEDKKFGRAIVKAAVMRAIFCPFTGKVLDMRRAVVIDTPTAQLLCSADHWDESLAKVGGLESLRAQIAGKLGRPADVKVYDGRELFK